MFIMYEGQSENDPDSYALFSLEGQRRSLHVHQHKEYSRDDRARRHKKKLNRILLWSDFARIEGRILFGDLRKEVCWEDLVEKLCIEKRSLELEGDEEGPILEDTSEMKEQLSREREKKLAQKKKARSKSKETGKSKRTKQSNDPVDTQPDFVVC
jgi:hypothetical protein